MDILVTLGLWLAVLPEMVPCTYTADTLPGTSQYPDTFLAKTVPELSGSA